MERLVTTSQAAQILGLSLQGVHYRIKKNQLKSIKKAGKIFVYVDDSMETKASRTKVEPLNKQLNSSTTQINNYQDVIEVKNEQISLLKKTSKLMRKQFISEISRLEKNQKRIIDVFNSEIKLLQSAFNEMRSIYKPQITNQNSKNEEKEKFVSIQDFYIYMKKHNKSSNDIKTIILKAIKRNDSRFIYNKKDKKLLILNEDFSDLI